MNRTTKVLHITETCNVSSIKKNGLLPKIPYLTHHKNYFGCPVIYTIPHTPKQFKYIKDFIYFHLWGKPRNLYLLNISNGIYPKSIDELPNHIKNVKILLKKFSILSISIRNRDILNKITHLQDSSMNLFTDINDVYSHSDKMMYVLKNKIPSYRIKEKFIGYPIIKNNKIHDITIKRGR